MSDKKPMGRDECFSIAERIAHGCDYCNAASHPTSACDSPAAKAGELPDQRVSESLKCVLAELEDTADKLSDCWIFLDQIARASHTPVSKACARLLKKHQAPGWKAGEAEPAIAQTPNVPKCPSCGRPLKITEKCPCAN